VLRRPSAATGKATPAGSLPLVGDPVIITRPSWPT
jgi:hypothetical protein